MKASNHTTNKISYSVHSANAPDNIDVLGVHSENTDPRPQEELIIDNIWADMRKAILKQIALNRERREIRESAAPRMWDKFMCPTLEAKMAFDRILQRV